MKPLKRLACMLVAGLMTVPLLTGCAPEEPQGNLYDILKVEQSPAVSEGVSQQSPVEQSSAVSQISTVEQPSTVSQISTVEQSSAVSQISTVEQSSAPSASTVTPAMWRVNDNQGHYCYMFGTIHAADDEALNLPDYFENAYADSEAIAVEIDISTVMNDPAQMSDMMKYLMYSDGTTIQDHISAEVYNGVTTVMKNNSTTYVDHMYDSLTPMAWSSLMDGLVQQKSGLDSEKGVDITLINRAKKDGRPVLEVESMELQLKMFERLSDKIGELMLMSYATQEGFDSQVDELKELFAKWKRGDPVTEDIDESALALLDKETREAFEYYYEEMLGKRNPGMADKVESYLKEGKKVLVMVGAAHFYDKNGLVNLMRQRGYTVTRISPAARNDTQVIGAD